NTRRRCCLTARCSLPEDSTATPTALRAPNSMTRQAEPGQAPAASNSHVLSTPRRCCLTARCSSQQGKSTMTLSQKWKRNPIATQCAWLAQGKRNCMIRRPEHGPEPAISKSHVLGPRRRCYLTARYSLPAVSWGEILLLLPAP